MSVVSSRSAIRMSLRFSSGESPPANPAEITRPGRWPSMRTSVARAAFWRPAPERMITTRRPSSPPSRATNPFPRIVTMPCSKSSKTARLDPQGEHDAEVAGLRFLGGRLGRRLRKLSSRGLNGRIADLGLRRVLEPGLSRERSMCRSNRKSLVSRRSEHYRRTHPTFRPLQSYAEYQHSQRRPRARDALPFKFPHRRVVPPGGSYAIAT